MSKFVEYLGTPANLLGSAATVAAVATTSVLGSNPFILVVAGVASYLGAYFIASPSQHVISMVTGADGEEQVIERSIKQLEVQIVEHRTALPQNIITGVEGLLQTLKDLLPRWEEMGSFTEQKYVVNSVVTDYLPNTLNTYLSLPKSYLVRTKKEAEGKVISQLVILQKTMDEIQDSVYKGVERKIDEQVSFLETKFTRSETLKLN